ncbi:hypothetical protein CYMTET_48760 [Cymbomonas tetramitiformis]|uniref:Right handed beta helix domain-containing protein n=1 Tax=Cymbomonas tetramitiformis TaxID=36881 RepID=A0AAE0EWH3_9CHLO|nr:hypothetical protein CYMTET_48760 [Cymbomonas tetramitiformis]
MQLNGGVGYVAGDLKASATVTNCNVSLNNAEKDGGAMYMHFEDYASGLTIAGSHLSQNSARGNGGVAFVQVVDMLTINEYADDACGDECGQNHVVISNCSLTQNHAMGQAGVLHFAYDETSRITLAHSTIAENTAQREGGAIFITGPVPVTEISTEATLSLSGCNLTANTASSGGALCGLQAYVAISDSVLRHNRAADGGGACSIRESALTFCGSRVDGNAAGYEGAGIAMYSSVCLLTNVSSSGNSGALHGGLLFTTGSKVDVVGGAFTDNAAEMDGGMAYMVQSQLNVTGNALISGNTAQDGGAVMLTRGSLTVLDSAFTGNIARFGGAVFLHHARADLQRVELRACEATISGGGVYASKQSNMSFTGGSLDGCSAGSSGGGLYVHDSTAAVGDVAFVENAAAFGGALCGEEGAHVHVVDCRLVANSAQSMGGALWAANGSDVVIRECLLRENEAVDGAAIAISSLVSASTVHRCVLENNTAHQGGAIFLERPPPKRRVQLQWLRFGSNQAVIGAHVFWEFRADAEAPECFSCVSPEGFNASVLASSAKSFGVVQNTSALSELRCIGGTSGTPFSPPLTFVALDAYDNIVRLVQDTMVTVSGVDNATLLDGQTISYYGEGGATFEGLAMTSKPGQTFDLAFQPSAAEWESLSLTVQLDACRRGEQHLQEANLCEPCEQASIKLSNTSAACTSCEGTGLTCPGGATYSLDAGYWVAADSVSRCIESGRDELACLLARIYACSPEEACTTSSNRTNAGEAATLVVGAEQCSKGYRDDVVMCGGCEAGYEMRYDGRCKQCLGDSLTRWAMASAVVLAVLLAVGLALLYLRVSKRMAWARFVDKEYTVFFEFHDMQHSIRILVHHLQVMSQHVYVFQQDVFPQLYLDLFPVSFFDFSPARWLGLQCLVAGSASGGTFQQILGIRYSYLSFLFVVAVPYLVGLPALVYVVPRLVSWLRNGANNMQSGPSCAQQHADAHDGSPRGTLRDGITPDEAPSGRQLGIAYVDEAAVSSTSLAIREACWSINPVNEGGSMPPERAPQLAAAAVMHCSMGAEATTLHLRDQPLVPCSMGPVEGSTGDAWTASARRGGTSAGRCVVFDGVSGICVSSEALDNAACFGDSEPSVIETKSRTSYSLFFDAYMKIAMFLLVLVHPMVTTSCFTMFDCEETHFRSDSADFWLLADRSVMCWRREWFLYAAISIFVMATYIVGLPIFILTCTYYLHGRKRVKLDGCLFYVHRSAIQVVSGEPRTDASEAGMEMNAEALAYHIPHPLTRELVMVEPVFQHGFGFGDGVDRIQSQLTDPQITPYLDPVISPFANESFYWMGIEILLRLAQTSIVILVRMLDLRYDLVYAMAVTIVVLVIFTQSHPYQSLQDNLMETLSLTCQALSLLGYMAERYVNPDGGSVESTTCGVMLLVMQTAFILVICRLLMRDLFSRIRGSLAQVLAADSNNFKFKF